jgi:hypothetical protein
MKLNQIIQLTILISLAGLLSTACEKKTEEHTEVVTIEFSFSPDPAVVNTVIQLKFEPTIASADDHGDDHGGEPIEISMVSCEIEAEGSGSHESMMLNADDDHGHYEGEWTFTDPGKYEIHFEYMYAGEMHSQVFSLDVHQN